MELLSRDEALLAGRARYFTGKPCHRNHISERYVSGYTCVECRSTPANRAYQKEYGRKHYLENKDKYDAWAKQWKEENNEKHKENRRKHYLENRDRLIEKARKHQKLNKGSVNAKNRKWRAENNEKVRKYNRDWYANGTGKGPAKSARRRKAVSRATPAWSDKQAIVEVYKAAQETGFVVDHIIPLTNQKVCGLHVHFNLQLLTDNENRIKGNRFTL